MYTKQINQYTAAVTIDAAADYLLIDPGGTGSYKKINRNTFLGLTSAPVGLNDSQTLTNKVLGNTNQLTLKANKFTLQDQTDTTKQLAFALSGLTTGNTRTLTVPDASGTLVLAAATQTLTNKTLTSPTINGGSLDNATVTVDSIAGHTASTTGSVYGISIAAGVLSTSNSVLGAALTNSSVTASKLNTGAASAFVSTAETTASTGYTDLATTSDTVTATIGANGLALVSISGALNNSGANANYMSFALSGANVQAASDNFSIADVGTAGSTLGAVFLLTGLAAGNTTFKAKYKVGAGTGTFQLRRIAVVPL